MVWRPEPVPGVGAPAAIATDPRSGAVALGDVRRVAWHDGTARGWRRVAMHAAVQDLAFDSAGRLWIATANGLFRLTPDARLEDRSPARGEAARDVRRLALARGLLAAATGEGGFVSPDGVRWRKLDGPSASGPATGIAARVGPGGATVWIAAEGGLFVAEARDSGAFGASGAREISLPLAGVVPLDVVATGTELVVVTSRALLELRQNAWHVHRPVWPPGVLPRRLFVAADRIWLATDRGLLQAPSLAGPWDRAAPPLGSASIRAVATAAGRLHVATERGYHVGELDDVRATEPGAGLSLPCEPPVVELQRVTLRLVQLEPRRVARLRRRVARRGWLPVVTLHGEWDRARDASRDLDEAFLSGNLRRLFDRDREHARDVEFGISLSWDLGDAVYDPEEIDVSTEARRLIELRDDVLDEVNQLYFERRRVLGQLLAQARETEQAQRLQLRAEELAAGLDAWTDGWFGCRVATCGAEPCAVRQ